MALCSDDSGIYNSMITLSAKEIFDKMHAISNEGEWHENIYCQDVIVK